MAIYSRRTSFNWPFPDKNLVLDLDFVNRRYWWGGRERGTSDFTTYVPSGSQFDQFGLTPSSTLDMTVALTNFASISVGAMMLEMRQTSTPGVSRTPISIDNGTTNERIIYAQSTGNTINLFVANAAVTQCNVSGGAIVTNSNAAAASSWTTNNFQHATNGFARTADTLGTLAVPTILRIGKSFSAGTELLGSLKRFLLFNDVKAQADLNALSRIFYSGAYQ